MGSVVVVRGFSCFAACAILLDQDQICVSRIGRRILTLSHQEAP